MPIIGTGTFCTGGEGRRFPPKSPHVLRLITIGFAGFALAAGSTFACEPDLPDAQRLQGRSVVLAFRSDPAPIPGGRHFNLDIAACAIGGGAAPELLRVDATMPEHRHGMNYRPGLKAVAPGRWRAEGLMFHMGGRWELVFELRGAAGTERLAHGVSLR